MTSIYKNILEEATKLDAKGIAYFTCYIWEELINDVPKKQFGSVKGKSGIKWENIKAGDWNTSKIKQDHNALIVITGSRSKGLVGIDWDIYEYDKITKEYIRKEDVYNAMLKMQEEIEKDDGFNTYIQTTGNNGYHWVYQYNKKNYEDDEDNFLPQKIGNSKFKIDNLVCGDIRGEGGLLIWAGTSYKGVSGESKEYEILEDAEIDTMPVEFLMLDCINKINNLEQNNTPKSNTTKQVNLPVSKEAKLLQVPDKINNEESEIRGLLCCINGWEDRETWMRVCFSLSNYPKYYNLVHMWARQTPSKYDRDATTKYLEEEGKKYNYGIGTLYFMAINNKEKYNSIFNNPEKNECFQKAMNEFNHNNLAEYFYTCFKYNYAYSEVKKRWYVLNPLNIWEESEDENVPLSIHNELIKTLNTKISNYISYLTRRKQGLEDEKDKDNINELIKLCKKNATKMGMCSFIRGIKELLLGKFKNDVIHKKLNDKRHIFAFNNCLFDLEMKVFRNIEPDDYITFTTGYEYNHEKVAREKIKEVNNILEGIFISEAKEGKISQLEFVKNMFASCLWGYNHWQKFFICTGTGSNGKSMITKFLELGFGLDYFKSIKSTFLTEQQTNAGAATAELTDKQYNHIMILSEPHGELIASTVKVHTGGDNIQSRGLYQRKVTTFLPKYTLFMLCNDIPKIRKPDSGFDRRVCIIEFTRKFEDVPVLDFHRKKDRTLENRIKKDMELRDAFMWILIEQIKELNMDMFIMDELTENVTNEYITSLNPLLDYINDNLEAYRVSGTAKTPYKMIDVYNDYKSKVEFERLNFKDFNEAMRYNNFVSKRHKMGYVWSNLIDPKSDYGKATFNQWKLQNKKEEEKENDSNEEDDEDAETETEIDMD